MGDSVVGVVMNLKETKVSINESLGGFAISDRNKVGDDFLGHVKMIGNRETQTARCYLMKSLSFADLTKMNVSRKD